VYRSIMRNMYLMGTRGRRANQHFAQTGFLLGFRLLLSPVIAYGQHAPCDDPPSRYTPQVVPGGILPDFATAEGGTVYDVVDLETYTILLIEDSNAANTAAASSAASALQKQFDMRGIPACTRSVALAAPHPRLTLRSLDVWRAYSQRCVLVVRPDLIVAWTLHSSGNPSTIELKEAVQVITGLNETGDDNWDDFVCSPRCLKLISYLEYLRGAFTRQTQPLGNKFPKAMPIRGGFKADVVKTLQTRDKTFKATTKFHAPARSTANVAAPAEAVKNVLATFDV